jgi:hypothetical protein
MSAEVIELQVKRRDPYGLLNALSVSADGWAKFPDGRWFKAGEVQSFKDLYDSLTMDATESGGFQGALEAIRGLDGQRVSFEIRKRGKGYERRVRWNNGEWEHDGTFPNFNAARRGLRGGQVQRLLRATRCADCIANVLAEHGIGED